MGHDQGLVGKCYSYSIAFMSEATVKLSLLQDFPLFLEIRGGGVLIYCSA